MGTLVLNCFSVRKHHFSEDFSEASECLPMEAYEHSWNVVKYLQPDRKWPKIDTIDTKIDTIDTIDTKIDTKSTKDRHEDRTVRHNRHEKNRHELL